MVTAHISESILKRLIGDSVFIIIGQYSLSCYSRCGRDEVSYVIFDAIECPDLDVIAEQIESLERVLPLGIIVVGVAARMVQEAILRENLGDHDFYSKLIMLEVMSGNTLCRSLSTSDPIVAVVEEAQFSHFPCTVHSEVPSLPLQVSVGSSSFVLTFDDRSCCTTAQDFCSTAVHSAIQLGASNGTYIQFPLTVCFAHTSGCSIFETISKIAYCAKSSGLTQCCELRSKRNPNIYYCYRTAPGELPGGCTILADFHNFIEDGACEVINAQFNSADTPKVSSTDQKQQPTVQKSFISTHVFLLVALLLGILSASIFS